MQVGRENPKIFPLDFNRHFGMLYTPVGWFSNRDSAAFSNL